MILQLYSALHSTVHPLHPLPQKLRNHGAGWVGCLERLRNGGDLRDPVFLMPATDCTNVTSSSSTETARSRQHVICQSASPQCNVARCNAVPRRTNECRVHSIGMLRCPLLAAGIPTPWARVFFGPAPPKAAPRCGSSGRPPRGQSRARKYLSTLRCGHVGANRRSRRGR